MNFIAYKVRLSIFIFFSFFFGKNSFALESLSYSGRLVQANGAPVTGSVNIRAELAYTNSLSSILCSQEISNVPLTNGVFHLQLNFVCTPAGTTLTQVLSQVPAGQSVAIQITDITNAASPKSYSFQALHAIPFASVASQLVQMNANHNEVLKWDDGLKKWKPGSTTGGTVTSVSVSAPLTISNPATTPSITISQASSTTNGYLSSADWNAFNSKQGALPSGGDNTHYYRGDNTWQTLNTDVVPEGSKLYFENARVLGVPLTGFTTASGAIVATDTVLEAFGKTQGQINSLVTDSSKYLIKNNTDSITGVVNVGTTGLLQLVYTPVGLNDATNKAYVDTGDTLKVNKSGDTVSGTLTFDGDIKVKGTGASTNYVTIRGNSSTSNYTLTLPSTAGTTGYILQTDGVGVLSWVNPSSTVMGTGTVSSASIIDGTIVDADINASAAIAQSKIAGLTTDLANKQPLITAGATSQYYRGDKTFVDLGTDVRGTALTGFAVGANSAIVAADTTLDAFQKVQGQINATNTAVAGKEPSLAAGTASQYYSGNKTWQTLNGSAVANTAAGNIAATNVQLALNELDTEKQANITSSSAITSGSVTTSLQNGVNINPFGAAAGNTGELRFYELTAGGTNYTSLKAPDALTADINYILPSVAPTAGQVLSSNASGVMSWLTIPSAPVTTVFGRTGAVVATAGDYNATQITNTPAGSIAATNVQAALNELDTDKQSLITAGTTAQYYRGDKTFVDLGTDVRATALTGYVVGTNTALSATDTTLGAFQKVQGQINATNTAVAGKEPAITAGTTAQYIRGDKTLSTFATDAINSVLSTFALNAGAKPTVATTDSVVGAFGKVQKFINDINSDYVSKSANQTINGTLAINSATGFITVPTPINPNDAANKAYVDGFGQWLENGVNIYFNTGNVGIGTTTPISTLNVKSTNNTGYLGGISLTEFGNTNYWTMVAKNNGYFYFGNDNGVDGLRDRFTFGPTGNFGIGTTSPTRALQVGASGDWAGTSGILVKGSNPGIEITDTQATPQRWLIANGVSVGDGKLGLAYNVNTSTHNLVVQPNGNVGIGVTAPTAKLEVKSSAVNSNVLNLQNSANTNSLFKVIENASGNGTAFIQDSTGTYSAYFGADSNMPWIGTSSNHDFRVVTNSIEKMRIAAGGNVGIGNSSPTRKLDVLGQGSFETTSAVVLNVKGLGAGYSDAVNGVMTVYSENSAGSGGNVLKVGSAYAPNSFAVKDTGSVGIGTLNPSSKLHVTSATANTTIKVESTAGSGQAEYYSTANGTSWVMGTGAGAIGSTNLGFYNAGNKMVLTTAGNLGIATETPDVPLTVNGSAAVGVDKAVGTLGWGNLLYFRGTENSTDTIFMGKYVSSSDVSALRISIGDEASDYFSVGSNNGGGGYVDRFWVRTDGNGWIAGTLSQASDIRLKKNIVPLNNSLERILSLDGVYYDWISKDVDQSKQIGLIAQEVQKVFPEVVRKNEEGFLSVSYSNLIAPVIESIKEIYNLHIVKLWDGQKRHDRAIASLKEENKKLNQDNQILKNENEMIKKYLCQKDKNAAFCSKK